MEVKQGNHIFVSQEAMQAALKSNFIKPYDFSPSLREEHDKEKIFDSNGVKIKLTREELLAYWKERLKNHTGEKLKEIKPGEVVVNPWIK